MAHDVFISHSSQDKVIADAVCAELEGAGIRCWIATRDVQPGARSFASEITRAIRQSKVMVLIFSAYSNTSRQVLRQVQLASNAQLHIVQFRIADVLPSDDLEFYLRAPHWLDASTPPLENHLKRLTISIKALLNIRRDESAAAAAAPATAGPPVIAHIPPFLRRRRTKSRRRRRKRLLVTGIIALGAIAIVVIYFLGPKIQAPVVATHRATPTATPAGSANATAATPMSTATPASKAKSIATALTTSGVNPSFAFVDMNRIFKEFSKTKEAEAKINAAKSAAKAEYEARTEAYKRKVDAMNAMPAGSSKDQAIAEVKAMEKEMNEFKATRPKELQSQAAAMRRVIVNEIEARVLELIDPGNNLVMDRSGMGPSGVPILMFCGTKADMTDRVISGLNGGAKQEVQSQRSLPIAVVDMNRVFQNLKKTKQAEAALNAIKDTANKEFDTRADAYKKKLESINTMSPGDARDRAITDVKRMEKEINDFKTNRQKELQDQAFRMRDEIVKEIEDFIAQQLIKDKQTILFDSSGLSTLGVPSLVYYQGIPDLAEQLIAGMNDGAAAVKDLTFSSTEALHFALVDLKRAYNAAPDRAQVEAAINTDKEKAKGELGDHAGAADWTKKEKEVEESATAKRHAIFNRIVTDVGVIGKKRGYQIILDSSGQSLNGEPVVLYSKGVPDVTEDVIADLGRKR